MSRVIPALSRGMLMLGGLLVLAGLAWGIRLWVNRPPEPVIGDAGAVVLAVTAPYLADTATLQPTEPPATGTPTPTRHPGTATPAQAPPADQTATPEGPSPTPTSPPATRTPLPTRTPTPTSPPPAPRPPGRIVAPSIDLDAQVTPMTWELVDDDGTMRSEWVVPKKAAGWHEDSALPGHEENVVLSGHHNIEGKVFRYVVDLELGDEIILYAAKIPYRYIVTEKYILKEAGMPLSVRQKNAQWIKPTGEERLTLVTCWPYEWPGYSHRVIVVARPPNYVSEEEGRRGIE